MSKRTPTRKLSEFEQARNQLAEAEGITKAAAANQLRYEEHLKKERQEFRKATTPD